MSAESVPLQPEQRELAPAPPGFFASYARRPLAMAALVVFVGIVFCAVFAPLVAPYDPESNDLLHVLAGPTSQHLLGTDALGRDVLSRLIYGARPALLTAAEAVLIVLAIGVPAGLVAGYFSGWTDSAIARVADIALSIPAIILLLVVLSVFNGNQTATVVAFGILLSPGVMRIVRSVTLSVRSELFVDAARVSGLTQARILFRHVLPRVTGPVIVQATLVAAGAILIEAALGFLGLGPPPPDPSWGEMVQEATTEMVQQPWLVIPAGLVLTLTMLSLGLIGGAVRDVTAERWSANVNSTSKGPVTSSHTEAEVDQLAKKTPDSEALLSVRDLSVVFPAGRHHDVPVVQHVSFDIHIGETLALLGESGCGKTVTSLAIIGLLPGGARVTSGQRWFAGKVLQENGRTIARLRGKEIGLIGQEPMIALDPVFTIGNQLSELVRRHDRVRGARCQARVIELLEVVGLPEPRHVMRLYAHELSGGMAQRVAIAMALAGRPKLLIADEPTTALDVTVQAEILELLRTLQTETGLAILLITHNWGVVSDICHRAVVMYAGQVVEYGRVDDLFSRPRHPYTEGLLLANPETAEVSKALPAIPGSVPSPSDWPAGCRFAPRCSYATDQCTRAAVDLVEVAPAHYARCIHSDRISRDASRDESAA